MNDKTPSLYSYDSSTTKKSHKAWKRRACCWLCVICLVLAVLAVIVVPATLSLIRNQTRAKSLLQLHKNESSQNDTIVAVAQGNGKHKGELRGTKAKEEDSSETEEVQADLNDTLDFDFTDEADDETGLDVLVLPSKDDLLDDDKLGVNANGILDLRTWMDYRSFNHTYTDNTVGGLSTMGLFSTWNDSAVANDFVPAINEVWDYGKKPMRGVNIGGWLVLEPFITPSLFDKYNAVDEWSLSDTLIKKGGMKLLKEELENHYSTFITEKDFRKIARAGLDHVRIPFPYWSIQVLDDDVYLPKVSWRYLLRGIEWARKYGLRVCLDLHTVPGSQNGWDHSGKRGEANWLHAEKPEGQLYGDMTLSLHTQLAEFFSQSRYRNIVTLYGLVNEPVTNQLGPDRIIDWTKQAYKAVREAGYENNIIYNDGLMGAQYYKDVFPADEYPGLVLDLHQYMVFDRYLLSRTHSQKLEFICNDWSNMLNMSVSHDTGHGPTMIGEWSLADTDCAYHLNFVGYGTRWEGTYHGTDASDSVFEPACASSPFCACDITHDINQYPGAYRVFLRDFAKNQIATYETDGSWGWMFWTWKTENNPQWSYEASLDAALLPQLTYGTKFECNADTDYALVGLSESI